MESVRSAHAIINPAMNLIINLCSGTDKNYKINNLKSRSSVVPRIWVTEAR